ncbi:phage terminase large subunit [Aurantimonas sp. C2-3-R2]|nr:phage terminase large subunit [Aurantimonas sp. C2-3-R2]
MERGEFRQLILTMPPRAGKACAHDTPILTPAGWRTHGDLKAGDTVFGPDGKPIKVLAVSADVDEVVPVTLSNGEVIRCHLNHEWTVYDRAAGRWRTLETREIKGRTLRNGPEGRSGRWTIQLPDIEPMQWPTAILPLHPYVLGAWLGDGSAAAPRIAHAQTDVEVVSAIEACGHVANRRWSQVSTKVAYATFSGPRPGVGSEMQKALRGLGVLNAKHIPEIYLRASVEQRLQLMAGLVDTDGYVDKNGRVAFSTHDTRLAEGVYDLASTLGFRPRRVSEAPRVSSSGIAGRRDTLKIVFCPTVSLPTRIPRKQIRRIAVRRRVGVVSIGEIEHAPARSICVDHPDGLYVVGRQLVVTHNTQLATKSFVAWYLGRNPTDNVAVATYSDTMAEDYGSDIRWLANTANYKQVFPAFKFRRGGMSKSNIQTEKGGRAVFVGVGGALTGRGAGLLICDDLIKGADEARSQTMRNQTWDWFTKVAMTRRMGKKLVVIIMTRWHSDDVIGRLTDPENPHYSREEAKGWKVINLPAIAEENDPLGREPGEPLWPERYDLDFLRQQQRLDPLGFAALYQQRPTVADGVLFRRETIQHYRPDELPDDLRIYCASDHAVSMAERRDPTVLLKVGVDKQDNIYVLDCIWKQMPADVAVEAMLTMGGGSNKPLLWWAEKGHISKSIGPFLRKRMMETGTYINLVEVTPAKDKETRAQSIAARVAMGKVLFPKGAFWAEKAVNEMLAFPNGLHDDFVDALAYIGLGLQSQFGPKQQTKKTEPAKFGTLAWVKEHDRWAEYKKRAAAQGGF